MPRIDDAQNPDPFLREMEAVLAGWKDPARRLRQALERDELELYAQPILALREPPEFAMAEVLVRLREEEKVLLPPGEFLQVFEHYGMMPALDRWVVRHAMARIGRDPRVRCLCVNVSGQTLGDAAFVPEIAAELARIKAPAASLVFEVSENDALARPESAMRFAVQAKAAGCKLTIDGFGQRASFAPLTALRADYVKVDGAIVRRLGTSPIARTKLGAIVRVGEVMGIGVIGECVENREVLAQLKAAGAGYAQGFGIGVPGPIDEVLRG